ncbi:MAG TPA: endolytic transglycosylase MltG, partial [Baekduia sp.]|nr:endolytic transglycosylase MltG [Baekduia sp.]
MTPLFGGKKGSGDDGGASARRSAAEREAARLERERRRAEREGRPLPPEPEPILDVPAFEPGPAEELAPSEPVYDPPAYDAPPAEPAYDAPFEPVGEPAWEPEPVTVPPDHDHELDEDTGLHPVVEAPAGVRRVPAPSVRDLPEVGGPRPAPPGPVRGPAGRPPRRRGVPRSRRGTRRVIPLLLLLLVVALAYFAYRVFQPGHDAGDAQRPVVVTIARGATAGEIADELADQGVVDSAFFFNLRSRIDGRRSDLKAGRFTLKRDMSYAAALDALTQNPAAAPTVTVTLPEGRSIGEAATLVRQSGVTGSYRNAATKNPRTVKGFKSYGVPKGT